MKKRVRKALFSGLTTVFLLLAAAVTLFPIVWIFLTSLKTDVQMFSIPPQVFPSPVTFKHYRELMTENFGSYFLNSLTVSCASCALSAALAIPAAYGFARYSRRKGGALFGGATAIRMVPQAVMVLPFFLLARNLRLSDSVWALILTYFPFECSQMIWILKNFFQQLPAEIEEAAEIDGLSTFGKLIRIVIPLSKSSVGVALVLAFLYAWNEFMFALSLTSTRQSQTLTIGIAGFVTSFQTFWGKMAAMSILMMIPALLVTLAFQKDLARGLTAGAVKG